MRSASSLIWLFTPICGSGTLGESDSRTSRAVGLFAASQRSLLPNNVARCVIIAGFQFSFAALSNTENLLSICYNSRLTFTWHHNLSKCTLRFGIKVTDSILDQRFQYLEAVDRTS